MPFSIFKKRKADDLEEFDIVDNNGVITNIIENAQLSDITEESNQTENATESEDNNDSEDKTDTSDNADDEESSFSFESDILSFNARNFFNFITDQSACEFFKYQDIIENDFVNEIANDIRSISTKNCFKHLIDMWNTPQEDGYYVNEGLQ
jgi:hypothetical protein